MNRRCLHCGATVEDRSRYCPKCGVLLGTSIDTTTAAGSPATQERTYIEAGLPDSLHITTDGSSLSLRDLINVVESSMRWWRVKLVSTDTVARERAAQSLEELSQILHSLSQQLVHGRETVRITTRLPVLRTYAIGCPVCGRGNRDGAKFCQSCGALLNGGASPKSKVIRPMSLRFNIAARTDQGRIRRNNQDTVFAGELPLSNDRHAYLCLVADGMGGARAGEQASRIASEVTQGRLRGMVDQTQPFDDQAWEALLRKVSLAANSQVYESARTHADQQGMGTTLTIALIVDDRVHIASVGDTRAYLLNPTGVTTDGARAAQLTSDHSLVARLVDIGQITPEQARTHPQRNLLYRSIGTDPSVEVDTRSEQLGVNDIILLCSDGLSTYLRDEELAHIVLAESNLRAACDQLIALANERGGSDNISVVIVRVEGSE